MIFFKNKKIILLKWDPQ